MGRGLDYISISFFLILSLFSSLFSFIFTFFFFSLCPFFSVLFPIKCKNPKNSARRSGRAL